MHRHFAQRATCTNCPCTYCTIHGHGVISSQSKLFEFEQDQQSERGKVGTSIDVEWWCFRCRRSPLVAASATARYLHRRHCQKVWKTAIEACSARCWQLCAIEIPLFVYVVQMNGCVVRFYLETMLARSLHAALHFDVDAYVEILQLICYLGEQFIYVQWSRIEFMMSTNSSFFPLHVSVRLRAADQQCFGFFTFLGDCQSSRPVSVGVIARTCQNTDSLPFGVAQTVHLGRFKESKLQRPWLAITMNRIRSIVAIR